MNPHPRVRLGTIGGIDAVYRLERQVAHESILYHGEEPPTRTQIAMVLHALADHTLIQQAMNFDPDPSSPWPTATSIGRFLHAYGDRMEYDEPEMQVTDQ